jgi:hypothetical protein
MAINNLLQIDPLTALRARGTCIQKGYYKNEKMQLVVRDEDELFWVTETGAIFCSNANKNAESEFKTPESADLDFIRDTFRKLAGEKEGMVHDYTAHKATRPTCCAYHLGEWYMHMKGRMPDFQNIPDPRNFPVDKCEVVWQGDNRVIRPKGGD